MEMCVVLVESDLVGLLVGVMVMVMLVGIIIGYKG